MKQTKIVHVGAHSYRLTHLGGVSAARVLLPAARLSPALVEASAALAAGRFGRASVALQAAQESDLAVLIDAFQGVTEIMSRAPNAGPNTPAIPIPLQGCFDDHFAGRIGDQIKWITECFEMNFADFLADMAPRKEDPPAEPPAT